jgi:hypothetical protein
MMDDDDFDDVAPPPMEDDLPDDEEDDYVMPPEEEVTPSGAAPIGRTQSKSKFAWSGGGSAGQTAIPTISRASRAVHMTQLALKYRMLMKPEAHELSGAEKHHTLALIHSYFLEHGFDRAADALQSTNALPDQVVASVQRGAPLALPRVVEECATRTSNMFDDESAWRAEAFFTQDYPLTTVDDRPNADNFASVDRLLEKLVLAESDEPLSPGKFEKHFTNIFLLSCSCFVCPDVLFSRMSKLFKTITMHGSLVGESKRVAWQLRLLSMLSAWISMSRIDITTMLTERILSFAISTSHSGSHSPEVVRQAGLLVPLLQRLGISEGVELRWKRAPHVPTAVPIVDVRRNMRAAEDVIQSVTDVPEVEVARQLCLIEFELFCAINTREFFQAAWISPATKPFSHNLLAFVEHLENVTLWVASLIVTPTKLVERQAMYARCIVIAHHLYDMQNFSTARAFLDGLDHRSVTVLTDTTSTNVLATTTSDELAALKTVFDPFYGAVRNMPWNLTTPCIPVLSSFVSKMATVADIATFHTIDDVEMVNWTKMSHIADLSLRMASYQSNAYPFQADATVLRMLRLMPQRRDEHCLQEMSKDRVAAAFA